MKQIVFLVCITITLTGCIPMMQAAQRQKQIEAQQAQQQKINDRQQQAFAEIAACVQKRKDHIFKTYVESSACINDATERGFRDTGYKWMDLVLALDARRSQLAAQVDAKKITEEDMKASLAEKLSEITSEELRRNSQLASTAAQQQQADAAQQSAQAQTISAFAQRQAAQQPKYQVSPSSAMPRITNCTSNAINQTVYTNCNQY